MKLMFDPEFEAWMAEMNARADAADAAGIVPKGCVRAGEDSEADALHDALPSLPDLDDADPPSRRCSTPRRRPRLTHNHHDDLHARTGASDCRRVSCSA